MSNKIRAARPSSRFRNSHVRERLQGAIQVLATSDQKLRERALDAYRDHLSVLIDREFPNQESREAFRCIRSLIADVQEKIEKNPGAYDLHLRHKLKTPHEIAREILDYRVARKLAKQISDLYFTVEAAVLEEYELELDQYRTQK